MLCCVVCLMQNKELVVENAELPVLRDTVEELRYLEGKVVRCHTQLQYTHFVIITYQIQFLLLLFCRKTMNLSLVNTRRNLVSCN